MATNPPKRKPLNRSASTESTEYSLTMGRSVREKKKKPKERWLLTRKTWRYMADAGRKLIPDGAQNRPEDIPKIEAYFQEVCRKEPRFLLWRKNSYPGALGFRNKKARKERLKGGSCRKACSADEVDLFLPPVRPKDLPIHPTGKFDLQKMKYEFLNKPPSPSSFSPSFPSGSSEEDVEEKQLITMLEQYLTLSDNKEAASSSGHSFNYQELIDKLQRHLTLASRNISAFPSYPKGPGHVHFNGDHVQKSLSETLNRYFGQYSNRQKIISDLLTDRKELEKLYFELRKARGFRGSRGGTTYSPSFGTHLPKYTTKNTNYDELFATRERKGSVHSPPPLIELEDDETKEIIYRNRGIQTVPVPETVLNEIAVQYKKAVAEKEEEERRETKQHGSRRRSSVDNDDISQSVSDTIKRYLRMARKKSVDSDKVDRFKRVNYDRNLRNIKAKGEITKPGDDDGLNKGCQTNDDWILKYRELKFDEETSDVESRFSSSRSSIDVIDFSPTSPPPSATKSQSFFSHLLHGKSNIPAAVAPTMQKSKSSSSVMHQGGRLMAKKIFRSRSKSQTRPSQAPCSWTPQVSCCLE